MLNVSLLSKTLFNPFSPYLNKAGKALLSGKIGNFAIRTFSSYSNIHFPATCKVLSRHQGRYPSKMIEKENDLFAADLNFSLANSGPIIRSFLEMICRIPYVQTVMKGHLPNHHIIIDSRTHFLDVGEYPAIPGWHTDFAERISRLNLQPDYSRITPSVRTYVVNFSDYPEGVSNTEYLKQQVTLKVPETQVYHSIDEQLNRIPRLLSGKAIDGEIIEMDQLSLHRGSPAHNSGWRGFLRVGILHDLASTILQSAPQNEIRRQVQSYANMHDEISCRAYKEIIYKFQQVKFTDPYVKIFNNQFPQFSTEQIKNEPMIVNGSMSFAMQNGGPITRMLLTENPLAKIIDDGFLNHTIKINTRVHMLMKGQCPDLHVWRSGIPFEKWIHPDKSGFTYLVTLSNSSAAVNNLLLFKNEITVENPVASFDQFENFLDSQNTGKIGIGPGQLIFFNNGMLHKTLPANQSEWRLTFTLTINDNAPENKIIRQARIYPNPYNVGW